MSQSYILENEFIILNNKDATIVNEKHYSLYGAKFFKDLFSLDDEIDEDKLITNYIKPSLTNFSLKGEIHLSSIYQLISFLENVSRGIYGDIVRMKGFIKIIDHLYHLNLLTYYIP